MTSPLAGTPLPVWLRRLRVMTAKEMRQLTRDGLLLAFTAYAFTVDVYLAGSGISLSLRNASMLIVDADHSAASRELASRFQPPQFAVTATGRSPSRAIEALDAGDALLALDIPAGFEKDLLRGNPLAVQVQIDTTNTVLGFMASAYSSQIVGEYGLEMSLRRAGLPAGALDQAPTVIDEHRVWFNPNQKDEWFMSIAELLMVITVFAMILPAAAMVREKERGTIEQLMVAPLSPFLVMFPKLLAMTLTILALCAISVFGVLQGVFSVPVRGSLALFFAVTALYVVSVSSIGLLIATFTRNLAQAGMLIVLLLAPMMFLSGAWTPPEAMPAWVRHLMAFSPLHYFIDAGYGILLRGETFDMLHREFTGIALLGGVSFLCCLARFRRQLS